MVRWVVHGDLKSNRRPLCPQPARLPTARKANNSFPPHATALPTAESYTQQPCVSRTPDSVYALRESAQRGAAKPKCNGGGMQRSFCFRRPARLRTTTNTQARTRQGLTTDGLTTALLPANCRSPSLSEQSPEPGTGDGATQTHRLRTAPGGRVTNSVDRIDRGQADRRNGGE